MNPTYPSTNPFAYASGAYNHSQTHFQPPSPQSPYYQPAPPITPEPNLSQQHYYGQPGGSPAQAADAYAASVAREQAYREGFAAGRREADSELQERMRQERQARYAPPQPHQYWAGHAAPAHNNGAPYPPSNPFDEHPQHPHYQQPYPQQDPPFATSSHHPPTHNTSHPYHNPPHTTGHETYPAWETHPEQYPDAHGPPPYSELSDGPVRFPSPAPPPIPPKPWQPASATANSGFPYSNAAGSPSPAGEPFPSFSATDRTTRDESPQTDLDVPEVDTRPSSPAARGAAMDALGAIKKKFNELRVDFLPPPNLEYNKAGSTRTVTTQGVPFASAVDYARDSGDVPKLTFGQTNKNVHAYDEELQRLLAKLDAVESGGDPAVRDARRELVRVVERETTSIDRWKCKVWVTNAI